jgi:serine/threonine protein kinase
MPSVGDVLDGYRLDAVLGRGGMGTVYRATDRALEKTVALKVIAPHLADDDTFVRRFREEAKALARLDADGIVDVYTLRETEQALFFVMEHIAGPSLDVVLQRRGALPPASGLELLRQVLAAVGHAHASGVLHRDLKPSNILLHDGEAVITDFGLAKILASDADLTATHEQLGTVAYMSPEQIEGLRNVDERSDLFSVGLIAYEVLTGRLPFDRSESDFVVQRAIVEESFPPPSAYAPAVPSAVETVVMDLLAKAPSARPAQAQAALARLPTPDADAAPLLDASDTPRPDERLSATEWAGLVAALLVVLGGAYAGVRGTLGLPLFSNAASPDTTLRSPSLPSSSASSPRPSATSAPSKPSADTAAAAAPLTSPSSASASASPPASEPTADRDASRPTDAPPSPSSSSRASAPPPARGALRLESTPSGATASLQDSLLGPTPRTVANLAPGRYRVRLRQDAHRPVTETISVAAGDTTTVRSALPPRPAVVAVRIRPRGTVRIDGRRIGTSAGTPVVDSVPPGTYQLTLASPRGRWVDTVTVSAGGQYRRTLDFTTQVPTAVTARTSAGAPIPNALVQVDGDTVGYTPQRLQLRVGQRRLRVSKAGYRPTERVLQVDDSLRTPLVMDLVPQ